MLAELAQFLLPPAPQLSKLLDRHWIIISGSAPPLDRVPFAALPLGEQRPLLLRATVSYSHGLDLLCLQQREATQRSAQSGRCGAVIIANTRGDLPEASTERILISHILKEKNYNITPKEEGNQSTKASVQSQLQDAGTDIIHFACHATPACILLTRSIHKEDTLEEEGLIADGNNKEKGKEKEKETVTGVEKVLTLIEPGDLYIAEIRQMSIGARLVYLSCCYSSTGCWSVEGTCGLARAFEEAGAITVIATLFAHPSFAGGAIAACFYYHLEQGETAAVALRKAQQDFYTGDGWDRGTIAQSFPKPPGHIRQDPFHFAGLHLLGHPEFRLQSLPASPRTSKHSERVEYKAPPKQPETESSSSDEESNFGDLFSSEAEQGSQ